MENKCEVCGRGAEYIHSRGQSEECLRLGYERERAARLAAEAKLREYLGTGIDLTSVEWRGMTPAQRLASMLKRAEEGAERVAKERPDATGPREIVEALHLGVAAEEEAARLRGVLESAWQCGDTGCCARRAALAATKGD